MAVQQPQGEPVPTETLHKCPKDAITTDNIVLTLSKCLLLLASLVATVTYAVGFNPPLGVWQDTAGHLAGDAIIRDTHRLRYLFFFYSNGVAFASSLVVIVLILLIDFLHKNEYPMLTYLPLRFVLLLDLVSLMVAYAAGTCRDLFTTLYFGALVTVFFVLLMLQMCQATYADKKTTMDLEKVAITPGEENTNARRLGKHKVLLVLATFAVSVTYVAGLSTPGGFWDSTDGGHRPGDSILSDRHGRRLRVFYAGNTTAFAASLEIIVVLLDRKLVQDLKKAYGFIAVALAGLVVAYVAGSSRHTDTTVYLVALVVACAAFQTALFILHYLDGDYWKEPCRIRDWFKLPKRVAIWKERIASLVDARTKKSEDEKDSSSSRTVKSAVDKARSLVLLLATLAATITYQAGVNPPGGVWQDNSNGHMAGDPILRTINARRYKTFFYCNSISFATSLVVIVAVQNKLLLAYHVLEVAMVIDLFGLIGAYAAGSCRDLSTSIYVLSLAGAVLVYVVVHVVLFTLGDKDTHIRKAAEDVLLEKTRKRLLLFAILAATITYQAGLTPPGGFRLHDDESGHNAGEAVLLYNYPRRYRAFFYSNSVSFMLSIALIILLVNPHVYRPAIRTYALPVCTVVGLFAITAAYAAGSTQHLKTSIYIFVLVAVVLFLVVAGLIGFLVMKGGIQGTENKEEKKEKKEEEKKEKKRHRKRKYLMLLGVLVASVTYQAGLTPPGGTWQSNVGGHQAGDPVMHDNRRARYLIFFYSNSASFLASVIVVILLLPKSMQNTRENLWLRGMNTMILLDLLALLAAYASGTSRGWKSSLNVVALVFAVLAYIVLHVGVSLFIDMKRTKTNDSQLPATVDSSSNEIVSI